MAVSTFDFDELDAAEEALQNGPHCESPEASCQAGVAAAQEGAAGIEAEVCKLVRGLDAADEVGRALMQHPGGKLRPRGAKQISKARAWFEIRRFFEAEPQKYYGSPHQNEWRTYYAKEMILKTACERLQEDGFVVIDARLAPEHFASLARQLLLDLPEEAAALKDHVPGSALRQGQLGWVGAEEQRRREELLQARSLSRAGFAADALALPRPADLGALDVDRSGAEARMSPHDRALCESCSLLLAQGRSGSSTLKVHSKQQFFAVMKTFIHSVAENSMSGPRGKHEDKVPVQLSFGNLPLLQGGPAETGSASRVEAVALDGADDH